jgi:hypothetical protein
MSQPLMKSLPVVAFLAVTGIWGLASIPAENAHSKPSRMEVRIPAGRPHGAPSRVSHEEVGAVSNSPGHDSVVASRTH